MDATHTLPAPPLTKPLMRGWSHLGAFVISVAGTAALAVRAPAGAARWAALVYGASLCVLFGTSALYHCPYWSLRARTRLKPLDHSAIFVLIAGTFTPFALVLGGRDGTLLLGIGWGMALLGVLRAFFWPGAPKKLVAAQSVLAGWSVAIFLPRLFAGLGWPAFAMVAAGGLLYTAGAVIFAFRRPNPWPRVFGFHEIFHLLVVAAAGLHFGVVSWVITRL